MANEALAQDFQRRYLEGERGAMAGLYAECRRISELQARAYIWKRGLSVPSFSVEDAAALATSRVLGRYRSAGYRVRSFRKTLGLEVIHELSKGGPKARLISSFVTLEDLPEQAAPPSNGHQEGTRIMVEDLLGEPGGKRIFLDLAINRAFRDACITISAYVTPDRILTESRKLREIHRLIHGKDKANGKHRGNGLQRNAPADQRDKHLSGKGKQADSLQGSR